MAGVTRDEFVAIWTCGVRGGNGGGFMRLSRHIVYTLGWHVVTGKKKKKKEKRSTGHKSSSTIISSFPVSMSIIDLASRFPGEAERRDSALLVHGHLTVFNPSTFIVSNGGGRPFAPTSK